MPANRKIPVLYDNPRAKPGSSKPVTVAAFGDLILTGEWGDVCSEQAADEAYRSVAAICADDDLVFANLEVATEAGDGFIAKEPRLISPPKTIVATLAALGVDVACLANNHAFDAKRGGFLEVRSILDRAGIGHLGAGLDAAEASRPLIVERRGIRFGWLAYVDLDTKPSHVAGRDSCGVNPFDEAAAMSDVQKLRGEVDHVIVSLHWGVEYCHAPSPDQMHVARRLIESGTSLIIGHHAHVIQGVEDWRGGAIAYNLGNVTTTDMFVGGRRAIRQTRRTRSSLLLRAKFTKTELESVDLVPIRASRRSILVDDEIAQRILDRANQRLRAGLTSRQWKRLRMWEDVVLRTLWKLDPRVMASIRPRHVANFFKNVTAAFSGRGPA